MPLTSTTSPGPDPRTSSNSAAEAVGDDVAALRADIANLATSVKQLATEQVGSSLADVQDAAMGKVGDLEDTIRRKPAQSALIAAGIGLVVGLILSR